MGVVPAKINPLAMSSSRILPDQIQVMREGGPVWEDPPDRRNREGIVSFWPPGESYQRVTSPAVVGDQRLVTAPDEYTVMRTAHGAGRGGSGGRAASTGDLVVWLVWGTILVSGAAVSMSKGVAWFLEWLK